MRTTDAAVGIMDSAYFVSKKELLDFFNATLDMNLTRIEQTASGAVACQLCELIFPKSVPVSRIDWGCKASFEYIANYKLLQAAFTKNRVRRHLDVDKLIRGKFQDNLEFCQWLKAFHDQQPPVRDGYDPAAVRAKGKGGKNLPPHFRSRGAGAGAGGAGGRSSSSSSCRPPLSSETPSRPPSAASTPRRSSSIPSSSATAPAAASSSKRSSSAGGTSRSSGLGLPPASSRNAGRIAATCASSSTTMKENATPSTSNVGVGKAVAAAAAAAADTKALMEANKKNAELTSRVAELELSLQKTEEERDFYFEKLRGIEGMVHAHDLGVNDVSAQTIVGRIGKVLDAAQGDEIPVDEGGNFVGAEGNASSSITAPIDDSAMGMGSIAAEDLLKEVADDGSNDMDLSLIEA